MLGGLVAIAIYWFYREIEPPATAVTDTLSAIPEGAAFILEASDIGEVRRELSDKSSFWSDLKTTSYFFELDVLAETLDSLIRVNGELRSYLADTPVAISMHPSGSKNFGFLVALQIEPGLEEEGVYETIKRFFKVTQLDHRSYDETNVFSFNSAYVDDRIHFYLRNEMLVFSFSEILIEESIRALKNDGSVIQNPSFLSVRETVDRNIRGQVYLNYPQAKSILSNYLSKGNKTKYTFKEPIADWAALDLKVGSESLSLSGFISVTDSAKSILSSYTNIDPSKPYLLDYLPSGIAYFSFNGFEDFEKYQEAKSDRLAKNNLLYSYQNNLSKHAEKCDCDARELITSWLADQYLVFVTEPANEEYSVNKFALLSAKDGEDAMENLRELAGSYGEIEESEYLEQKLIKLPIGDLLSDTFGDAFDGISNPFVVLVDDEVLAFANSENALRNYIGAISANRVFTQTAEHELISPSLFKDAHLIIYGSISRSPYIYERALNAEYANLVEENREDFKRFGSVLYQVSHSTENLFYNHISIHQQSDKKSETGSLWEVALNSETTGAPHLIKNHYTGVLETLIQDQDNRLYMISAGGKILWEKDVDGPILGTVQQIDLYKNKKLQILFSTKENIHLLDRNGNNVESFPVSLGSFATAPLGVVDYDRSRDYRLFIPVEGDDILCFDGYGKKVKGWDYKSKHGAITNSIEHIRIKNKDYLFTHTEDGDVLLLNRKGKIRHPVSTKIDQIFGGVYVIEKGDRIERSELYYADSSGTSFRLRFDGGVEKFNPKEQTLKGVIYGDFDSNDEMDFGFLYEDELSFYSFEGDLLYSIDLPNESEWLLGTHQYESGTFISLVDRINSTVYLYRGEGNLIDGFPIYGSGRPVLGDVNLDGTPDLVTTGKGGYVYAYMIKE